MDSAGRFNHLAPRNPDGAAILEAAVRRNPTAVSVPGRTPRISRNDGFGAWDSGHSVRQEFRRLLDPGILRKNNPKDAVMALKARVPIYRSLPCG